MKAFRLNGMAIIAILFSISFTSCGDNYDDSIIIDRVDNLEDRVTQLEEILRLQTDKTGQRPYRLSREGFDLAIDILLPPDISKKKSIRYEDFVK